MPRPGNKQFNQRPIWGRNNNNQRFSNEHDDRERPNKSDNKRRVSFKPSGGRPMSQGLKNADLAIRTIEGDDDMMNDIGTGVTRGGFHNGRQRGRRGSPVPFRSANKFKRLVPSPSGWYMIIIPFGQKYEKELLFKMMLDAITPTPFIPQFYSQGANWIQFYVDDEKMAQALLNIDRKLQMPDGFRMAIRVRNTMPTAQLDDASKERIKLAMVKRYAPATKAMDLTKFHADPDLHDIFCGLARPQIMLAVIEIIAENIPDLQALNLNENKLNHLDHFKILKTKLPELKILYMAHNKIPHVRSLDHLSGLPITELLLLGNPFKDRLKDDVIYVSEVRKRFPKLTKLDHVELPPEIGFDLEKTSNFPTAKASFLCNPNGSDIVREFVALYFRFYDSDNRQPLLDAYHEKSMMSMTCTSSNIQTQRLNAYLNSSRNLMRVRDFNQRKKLLKHGKLQIVSFLSDLPKTEHDALSFAADLVLFTPQQIIVTITGLYKEMTKDANYGNFRSFQRSWVLVPSGGGFCIKNEMLHINNVTGYQAKVAFKERVSTVESTPIPSTSVPTIVNVNGSTTGPSDETKMAMVQTMAQQSNMNLEWSKKCLEEMNWDFDRAALAFSELQKQNGIPPEAFIK